MEHVQFIECVTERDIDLLLLEELHVSPDFRTWLLRQAFGSDFYHKVFLNACHSVCHPILGESDLLLLFEDAKQTKAALLIENKIDAPPQPEQAARYNERGKIGTEEGSWDQFRTCIIAPHAYLVATSDASAYDSRVSYESIRDWFQKAGTNDERFAYKARILQEAIEQNRRGYRPLPHAAVTEFWAAYWSLACVEFPQLGMKRPGKVPPNSDWPTFRPPELGFGRLILHKLAVGAVDLQIASFGDRTEEIVANNSELLDGSVEVVKTGKSASIRAIVPKVDRFKDFSLQVEAVRAGLLAASRLFELSPRVVAD